MAETCTLRIRDREFTPTETSCSWMGEMLAAPGGQTEQGLSPDTDAAWDSLTKPGMYKWRFVSVDGATPVPFEHCPGCGRLLEVVA